MIRSGVVPVSRRRGLIEIRTSSIRDMARVGVILCAAVVLFSSWAMAASFDRAGTPALVPFDPQWTVDDVRNRLAAGADVNLSGINGVTPLIAAAGFGQYPEVVRLLLDSGADVNARAAGDLTALMTAAAFNSNAEVLEMLIAAGAEVNAVTYEDKTVSLIGGVTPLISAAMENPNPAVIETLIAAGADPNMAADGGATALHAAASMNESHLVTQALINGGANVHARDDLGATPLIRAAWNPNFLVAKALIDAGAHVNVRDDGQGTPLAHATSANNVAVVKLLISAGSYVDAIITDGVPELVAASAFFSSEVVRALIDAGATVNVADPKGVTPLIAAVEFNPDVAVAQLLLEAGADVDARDQRGLTALMIAREMNRTELVRMLIDAGADPSRSPQLGGEGMSGAVEKVGVEPIGVYAEIDVELMNETMAVLIDGPQPEREKAIERIVANSEKYAPPVFYALSYVLYYDGQWDDAVFWFHAGQLRARFDANRSTDDTAAEALSVLDQYFGPMMYEYAMKDIPKLEQLVLKVIDWDRSTPYEYDHRWINLFGMETLMAALEVDDAQEIVPVLSVPEEQWEAIAEQTRIDYLEQFREIVAYLKERMEQGEAD